MTYVENQATITKWAEETFGAVGSNASAAARANEEMAELLQALARNDYHPKAAEEVADVVIVLYRLATRLGSDLHAEIDRKMKINRGLHLGVPTAAKGRCGIDCVTPQLA